MSEKVNSRWESCISAHSFRGFSPWFLGSAASGAVVRQRGFLRGSGRREGGGEGGRGRRGRDGERALRVSGLTAHSCCGASLAPSQSCRRSDPAWKVVGPWGPSEWGLDRKAGCWVWPSPSSRDSLLSTMPSAAFLNQPLCHVLSALVPAALGLKHEPG